MGSGLLSLTIFMRVTDLPDAHAVVIANPGCGNLAGDLLVQVWGLWFYSNRDMVVAAGLVDHANARLGI